MSDCVETRAITAKNSKGDQGGEEGAPYQGGERYCCMNIGGIWSTCVELY